MLFFQDAAVLDGRVKSIIGWKSGFIKLISMGKIVIRKETFLFGNAKGFGKTFQVLSRGKKL